LSATTCTGRESDFPSLVAEIVASPTAMAVTIPVLDTVATFGALLVHTTGCPASTAPVES